MQKERIIEIVSQVLKVPSQTLDLSSSIGNVAGWDSLAQLEILERLEGESGRKLSVDEAIFSESLSDLVDLFSD